MAPKVTLSIPEDLAKELESLRDDVNLSQVFQQAMWAEVRKRREVSDLFKDLPHTITHLRSEHGRASEVGYRAGFRALRGVLGDDAEFDEQYLTYTQIRDWVRRAREAREGGDPVELVPQMGWNGFFDYGIAHLVDEKVIDVDEKEMGQVNLDDLPSDILESYARGWHEAVLTFWSQVEGR